MATLTEIGKMSGTDKATYHGFTDFYEEEFALHGLDPKNILEIGVKGGASLKMWHFFYPKANIIGMDINEMPRDLWRESGGLIRTYQESGTDPLIANRLFENIYFDLIIDDGSHMTADQLATLTIYWKYLRRGGIFVMEDLHTSFLDGYINSPQTTYEHIIKNIPVEQYKIWARDPSVSTDSLTCLIFKP
jgi:cephalosporin hydroxylase